MNRRNFLQTALAGTCGLALGGMHSFAQAESSSGEQPNIVVIMADDMIFSATKDSLTVFLAK